MSYFRRRRDQRRRAVEGHVLLALRDGQEHFAYPLRKATGIRSGLLYPALTRLEQQGLVTTGWEDPSVNLHPRRWYMITPAGLQEFA